MGQFRQIACSCSQEEDHSTLARDFELFCEDTALIGMIGVYGSLLSPFGGFIGSALSNRYGRRVVFAYAQVSINRSQKACFKQIIDSLNFGQF